MEVRDSDFIEIVSRDHLAYTTIEVAIDKESIKECLKSRELSSDTQLIIEMISTDRRTMRSRFEADLFDYDFDEFVNLRCYTPRDVIQITFKDDMEESFVVLKCRELPLSKSSSIPWYA